MTMRGKQLGAFVLAVLCALTLGSAAEASEVLASDGTIYRLLDDRYGTIFADGTEADAESRVLALEITAPDGLVEHLLVPETAGSGAEISPQLVYEKNGDTLFILWEGILNDLHPLLYLASFRDGSWGEVLEISGNPFARKGRPQLRVTRDRDRSLLDEAAEYVRTTLHIVWWEETAGGSRKRYAPVVIDGANLRSWHPTWDLSDFVPASDDPALHAFTNQVRLAPGTAHNSVLVGFQTTGGDRVVSLEAEVLPPALAGLADSARFHIIHDGARALTIDELAASVEAFMLDHGDGFDPVALGLLAESTARVLRGERLPLDGSGLTGLGDTARFHIIHTGLRIANHGISEGDDYELIEIERLDAPGTFHVLKMSVLSDRAVPAEIPDAFELFLSVDGRHAVLAWQGENTAHYIESVDEGWGPIRSLALSDDFTFGDVHAMLESLARSR